MPIIKNKIRDKKDNLELLNKYIKTNGNERNRDKFKIFNFLNEPKIYSYLSKNEKSNKVIINKQKINFM